MTDTDKLDELSKAAVLDAIGEALLAAYYVLEDGEDDGSGYVSSPDNIVKRLDEAFDVFEEWPDEPPYQCGPAAKAQWALKCLFATAEAEKQAAVEAEREACAAVALRHCGYEPSDHDMHTVTEIAIAIRARGDQT